VTLFRPGDRVWWAGQIDRPGSDADFQLVDERIVGRKPESLDWGQAAADRNPARRRGHRRSGIHDLAARENCYPS